jgi:hypothetical protein
MNSDGSSVTAAVSTITERMGGLEKRTVQRGLAELVTAGWLWAGRTPGKTTRYDALIPPRDSQSPPTHDSQSPHAEPVTHGRKGVTDSPSARDSQSPELEVPDLESEQDARVRARGDLHRGDPDPDVLALLERARRGDFGEGDA